MAARFSFLRLLPGKGKKQKDFGWESWAPPPPPLFFFAKPPLSLFHLKMKIWHHIRKDLGTVYCCSLSMSQIRINETFQASLTEGWHSILHECLLAIEGNEEIISEFLLIWHCINCLLSQAAYWLNARRPLLISSAILSDFRMGWKDARTGASEAVTELSIWPLNVILISQPYFKEWKGNIGFLMTKKGFPGGTSGNKPVCQCRRHKTCRFDPWVRKIPWRRAWQPAPVFLPGESHGQRSVAGYRPWVGTESHNWSYVAHTHTFTNNPMYGEAWNYPLRKITDPHTPQGFLSWVRWPSP